MTLNMDDPVPLKKRRTEGVHDKKSSNGGATKEKARSASEIVAVSLKLDKLQKLKQRIATSCKEKNQNPKPDDEFVISSVGSSPSSSPRSNYLAALSKSVDPFELHARLASLAQQEVSLKSSEDASINVVKMDDGETSVNKCSGDETADAEVQKKKDVSTSGSISKEELYAVLQKLVSEKCKKIEEKYVENIIPDLERKISALEVENKRLSEQSNQLQEKLSKMECEQKKPSETARIDVAVQAGFPLPPSLTSVSHTIHVTSPQVGKSALLVSEADVCNKQPAMTVLQTFSPVISAPPPYLARSPTGKTNPSRYLSSGSYVLTTAAGEPRLYSDAPYKQVSRQNTGIQRTQTPTIQPTATVRPQPQNLQASPSTLVAHRGPPPLPSSSNRITFNSQGPMVHTQAQPHGRYVVNQVTGDLRGLSPYLRAPQMREANSRPVTIANTSHVGGSRPNLIHSGSLTAGHIPVNPPPLVRAQTHMYSRAPVNNAQRYALRQRPPYHPVPDTRPQTRHTTPFSHPSAPTSHPQASLNVRPNGQPPPKPTVSISGAANGIVLSWDMFVPQECAPIDSYQLYACQDHNQGNSSKITWKKLGIVKALPLPMACTLTQFVSGCMYYFSVRAIDVHGRSGDYSTPRAITLPRENEKEQT